MPCPACSAAGVVKRVPASPPPFSWLVPAWPRPLDKLLFLEAFPRCWARGIPTRLRVELQGALLPPTSAFHGFSFRNVWERKEWLKGLWVPATRPGPGAGGRGGRGLLRAQERSPQCEPEEAAEGGRGTREACLEAAAVSGRVLQELVEYYQCHSLKESFKQLDTTLKYPYKSRERAASRTSSRSPGSAQPLAHQCSPGGVHSAPVPTAQPHCPSALRKAFCGPC